MIVPTPTTRELRILAGAAAALVLAFAIEHWRDSRRDAELVQLHQTITADSTVRVAAVAKTDTAIRRANSAIASSKLADSGWTRARTIAHTVPAILAASIPDTVKIERLVKIVDTLVLRGDSLARAAAADTLALVQLRASTLSERTAWTKERADLSHALDVSETRRRHWGLGTTLGYGIIKDGSTFRGGPALAVGLTYRW